MCGLGGGGWFQAFSGLAVERFRSKDAALRAGNFVGCAARTREERMGRNMVMALVVLAGLPLVGCGMTEITQADVALEDARTRARTACVEARARAEEARMHAIGNMPEAVQGMAMMGDAMARQSENLSGKDPCGQGMGAYDIRAIEVREKNQTARSGMKAAASGSAILYGIDRLSAVAEEGIKKAGDRVSQTASEGSTVGYTQERVTSDATITTKAVGEGTATSGAPTVSGPDKSSATVHEAPAEPEVPEEPEAEEPEAEFEPAETPDFPAGPVEIPGPEPEATP